jgi:hypothetical protein
MLIENINYIDLITEGIKAILVLVLIFILWRCGKKYPELAGGSWNLIIFGFIGIDFAMFLDWSDEIVSYRSIDLLETIIEEGSSMLGFVLITVGFSKWFEFVGKFLGMDRS